MPLHTLRANSLGTYRLLDVAAEVGASLLFVSTSEVYGDPLVHPQPESYWGNVDPIGPRSCYDEAKRFGEALVFAARREIGCPRQRRAPLQHLRPGHAPQRRPCHPGDGVGRARRRAPHRPWQRQPDAQLLLRLGPGAWPHARHAGPRARWRGLQRRQPPRDHRARARRAHHGPDRQPRGPSLHQRPSRRPGAAPAHHRQDPGSLRLAAAGPPARRAAAHDRGLPRRPRSASGHERTAPRTNGSRCGVDVSAASAA